MLGRRRRDNTVNQKFGLKPTFTAKHVIRTKDMTTSNYYVSTIPSAPMADGSSIRRTRRTMACGFYSGPSTHVRAWCTLRDPRRRVCRDPQMQLHVQAMPPSSPGTFDGPQLQNTIVLYQRMPTTKVT